MGNRYSMIFLIFFVSLIFMHMQMRRFPDHKHLRLNKCPMEERTYQIVQLMILEKLGYIFFHFLKFSSILMQVI